MTEFNKLHYISTSTMFRSSLILEKLLDHMDKCKECQKLWDDIIHHYENLGKIENRIKNLDE